MKTLLTIFCCLLLQTLSFSQKDISKNHVSKKTTKKNGKVVTVYGFNFDCSEKDEKDVEWDDIYENNINEVRESNAGTLIIRPNPFLYQVHFDYELNQDKPTPATFRVFDVSGRLVATIFEHEQQEVGPHQVMFDASELVSGTYFFELSFEGQRITHKGIKIE